MENAEVINLYLKTVLYYMKKGVILSTNKHSDSSEGLIRQTVRYINANIFERPLTVEEVSGIFNISPEHFSRSFKKGTGVTPIRYIFLHEVHKNARIFNCFKSK